MLENPVVPFLRETLKTVKLGDIVVRNIFPASQGIDLPVFGLSRTGNKEKRSRNDEKKP
jgi:hypothetical protein